jgi:hypothetical protein
MIDRSTKIGRTANMIASYYNDPTSPTRITF